MAISSPNVIQGKENPVISALKYANDGIKQSLQLMQNAKQLGIQEKEANYTKNLALLTNIQRNYELRSAEVGPLAAWDEQRDLMGSVYSALGMDPAAIAAHAKAMAEAPYSQSDYQNAVLNSMSAGKTDLSNMTPDDITKAGGTTTTKTETVMGAGKGTIKAQYEEKFTPEQMVKDKYLKKFAREFVDSVHAQMTPKGWEEVKEGYWNREWISIAGGQRMRLMGKWGKEIQEAVRSDQLTTDEANALMGELPTKLYPAQGYGAVMAALGQISEFGGEAITGIQAKSNMQSPEGKSVLGRFGWVTGQNLPVELEQQGVAPSGPVSRAEFDRVARQKEDLMTGNIQGPAGATLKETGQGAQRAVDDALARGKLGFEQKPAERGEPGYSDNVFVLKSEQVPGVGPAPGEDKAKFVEKRAAYWKTQKLPSGAPIDDALAANLAKQESLIPPSKQVREVKTNVPVNPATEPSTDYKSSGVMNTVVPPYVEPDSVNVKTAWNAGRSLYDWWAKRMAGADFGKGDVARMDASLKAYTASLPSRARQLYTDDSANRYLMLMGNGDMNKGLERFRYALNTEAANAETQRMSEDRMGRTSFTFSQDTEIFGMKFKAGQKLNASEAGVYIGAMQAMATGSMAEAAGSYVNGEFLQKSFTEVSKMLGDVAQDIQTRNKGNKDASNLEWENYLKSEVGSGQITLFRNLLRNMWTFFDKDGTFLGVLGMNEGQFYKHWFLGKQYYQQPTYQDPGVAPGQRLGNISAAQAEGMPADALEVLKKQGWVVEGEQ